MPLEEASLRDKYFRRLVAALRLALWVTALRHGLTLLRLGWANARVLRGFAPGQGRAVFRAGVWLPFRRYARLFRPAVLLPPPNPKEMERILGLHRRLNKIYAGYQSPFDPLTGLYARRLQAAMVRYLFRRLFHLRLQADEALLLAGYGSAGMAVRDFLNYASSFGWFVPLALPFQLFLSEVLMRHARVSTRQSILRTLRAIAGLHWGAGLLHCACAVWYAAERLLCRAYWEAADRRERKLRLSIAHSVQVRESAEAAHPLRRMAASEQQSLLVVLADEMLWHAMDELLELRAQMPKTSVNLRRFEAARAALENNLESVLPYQFREENEDVREVA
jgi:hypothetical protein